jgi:hypothetical protein
MVLETENTAQAGKSLLDRESPFIQVIALFGIPSAGSVALVLLLQISRFIYGESVPLLLAAEIVALFTVLVLLFVLRACLALPSAPSGFYRNVLDFLAMARWHPAVKAALVGLLVLPPLWYISAGNYWIITMFWKMGRRALTSSYVHSSLDGLVAVYQLSLTGGVPLLFTLHMLSRRKKPRSVLLWLLVPLLFVGAAIGVIFIVTLTH